MLKRMILSVASLPRLMYVAVIIVCAMTMASVVAHAEVTRHEADDDRIHLIHSDVLYKNYDDPHADVLVGHVRLRHKGGVLVCDSAKFYREDNSFDAYGHCKYTQGDTLSLVGDTLFYDGNGMSAKARGHVILTHRKTRLKTNKLDYDRLYDVGMYMQGGTLYDGDNVLTSEWGQYTPSTHESFFTDNVELTNPSFKLISDTLYYNTQTKLAEIVSPTNINTKDETFVYGLKGKYNTNTGATQLMNRSYIIKDMRKVVADTIFYDNAKHVSHAIGDAVLTDDENMVILTGDNCEYNDETGYAMATDRALVRDYSQGDTIYVHADTLKMFTFNMNTDSVTRNIHAYHKVRAFRTDVQAVCDSMVSIMRDSCTYLYGQPIVWNEGQQLFGEEIRIYNNDSTVRMVHVIRQAMAIEQTDSATFNQVASKEMFSYFKNGEIERNEAEGNVYVIYFITEDNGAKLFMNYCETTKMIMYMEARKIKKIWMPAVQGNLYPIMEIPPDKRRLKGFAWFDYVRPKDGYDVFNWRNKSEDSVLKRERTRNVPIQKLDKINE